MANPDEIVMLPQVAEVLTRTLGSPAARAADRRSSPSVSAPLPYVCTKPDDVPNRVSIDETSSFFWPNYGKLGVRSQGIERNNDVVEFDVAAGWFRVFSTVNGRRRMERGRYVTVKITRQFDVFYKPQVSI